MPITLTNPGELAGLIPTVLGFTPKESVVVVSLRKSGLIGAMLRVDLADLTNTDVRRTLAHSVGKHLVHDLAKSATLLMYSKQITDLDRDATIYMKSVIAEEYLSGNVEAYRVCGVTVAMIDDDGTERRPMAIVTPQTAHPSKLVLRPGRHFVTEEDRRTADQHRTRWLAKQTGDTFITWRKASHTRLMKAVTRTAATGPTGAITPGEAGKLVAALSDKRIRDAVIVGLISDEETARGVLDGSTDDKVSAALKTILSANGGVRPNMDDLTPLWGTLVLLDGHATGADRAPMLTLLALLSWWDGDMALTASYLDEVETLDPAYRLAGLLRCTLLAGIKPGWMNSNSQAVA